MARSLTERQQRFLDVLFDDAGGDVVAAKKLAGYGDNSSTTSIVEALKDEIAEKTRTYFARTAPKAAVSLMEPWVRRPILRSCKIPLSWVSKKK